jgi:DNA repair exonuclease SbcCD nuclease subunit
LAYKIGFFADTHLGYATRCRSHASGLNMRVRDGYLGMRETIDQMLAEGINLALHGGDLFHRSHPTISDIAWGRRQLERLSDNGIHLIGVTGNHDFANDKGKSPATAAVHDPSRNIHMVTEPYKTFEPAENLTIHAVSHIGLAASARALPEPVDGHINILISHGAAQIPGHEIFATVDSPGEAVIGYDVLTKGWDAALLGHYHGMGALPGFNSGDKGQIWYVGSLLRRGFSDPEGGRGWLLVTIEDDGKVTIEPKYIKQRPQFDLPRIDATGLTGAEVEKLILSNLSEIKIEDSIVRQRVINCPLAVRRGVDNRKINELTEKALVWQAEYIRPMETEFVEEKESDRAVISLSTAGSSDLPTMFKGWFTEYAELTSIPKDLRNTVEESCLGQLKKVSTDAETGTSELGEN